MAQAEGSVLFGKGAKLVPDPLPVVLASPPTLGRTGAAIVMESNSTRLVKSVLICLFPNGKGLADIIVVVNVVAPVKQLYVDVCVTIAVIVTTGVDVSMVVTSTKLVSTSVAITVTDGPIANEVLVAVTLAGVKV